MKKFVAIEGLRGWLAWAVVFSHLSLASGFTTGFGRVFNHAGSLAVTLFIVVSGFVITHILIERPEPYSAYILRRFLRIFPLFAVTCVVGFFTGDVYALILSRAPYANGFVWSARLSEFAQSSHDFFWPHVLAHLTMLHGAVSHSLLPFSLYAFNPPAWSLSLEWQFYLIAPLILLILRFRQAIFWLALALAISEMAFRFGLFGSFELGGFLPASAGYFAIGIASRLGYPLIAGKIQTSTPVIALIILVFPIQALSVAPILTWTAIMTRLALNSSGSGADPFARFCAVALESRAAVYFGQRSYSVYLCHLPIIALSHSFLLVLFPSPPSLMTFLGLSTIVVPFTFIISGLLYHSVERPGIELAARLLRCGELESRRLDLPRDINAHR